MPTTTVPEQDPNNAPDPGVPAPAEPTREDQLRQQLTDPNLVQGLLDRLKALESEKASRDRADAVAAGQPVEHPPTHVLALANGKTLKTVCPSITHVDDEDDGLVPVIGRYEINPT